MRLRNVGYDSWGGEIWVLQYEDNFKLMVRERMKIVYVMYRKRLIKTTYGKLEALIRTFKGKHIVYPQYHVIEWDHVWRTDSTLHYEDGCWKEGIVGLKKAHGHLIFPGYVPDKTIHNEVLKIRGMVDGVWRHDTFNSADDKNRIVIRKLDPINNAHNPNELRNYAMVVAYDGAECEIKYPYVGVMIERMG